MNKKTIILTSIISIFLIVICTLVGTYSVIINVTEEDGVDKIVNEITIRDLLTDDNGNYNSTYYTVKNELNITDEEAELLIQSTPLNNTLKTVLDTIVDYKLHNNSSARLSNEQLYNMIVSSVNKTTTIEENLKTKVINKANVYRKDISDFVYDLEVTRVG